MREREILDVLASHPYVPTEMLAKILGVSARTIRNDLSLLKDNDSGFYIKKNKQLGYQLVIDDTEKYQHFIASLQQVPIENQEFRLESMLVSLLIRTDYVTIQNLSEEFMIGLTQVKNDLNKIERYLQGTSLELERKAHYGILLHGTLKNRILLLVEKYNRKNQKLLELLAETFSNEAQTALKKALQQLIHEKDWQMNYLDFQRLQLELLLLLLIQNDQKQEAESHEGNSLLAEVLTLANNYSVVTPQQEEYFAYSFLAKTKNLSIQVNQTQLKAGILTFFQEIDQERQTGFAQDLEFIDMMFLHVAALIERSKKQLSLSNPYVTDISLQQPTLFNDALRFTKWLEDTYQMTVNQEELGFLTIHIAVSQERQQQAILEKFFRIGVVCSSGGGVAYLIELRLKRIFPNATIKTFSMFQIEEISYFYPDLVFSIIELRIDLACPVILIDEVQGELDYLEVSENLEWLTNDSSAISLGETFFSLLNETLFFIEKELEYPKILEKIATTLEASVAYPGYKQSLLEREEFLSTIYQNGVAIPHPIEMKSKENRLAICLIPKEGKSRNKELRIIFMVSLKENQLEVHKLISRELSKVMENKQIVKVLSESTSYQEFYYALKKFLGRRKQREY